MSAEPSQARRILDDRNGRKKALDNAQMLANRIQHLKDEVEKASRRTAEADKRAEDIEKQKKLALVRKEANSQVKKVRTKLVVADEVSSAPCLFVGPYIASFRLNSHTHPTPSSASALDLK
jgi:hypothetical protein